MCSRMNPTYNRGKLMCSRMNPTYNRGKLVCSRNVTSSASTSGIHSFYISFLPDLTMSKQRMSYKNQELRKHHGHPSSSPVFKGPCTNIMARKCNFYIRWWWLFCTLFDFRWSLCCSAFKFSEFVFVLGDCTWYMVWLYKTLLHVGPVAWINRITTRCYWYWYTQQASPDIKVLKQHTMYAMSIYWLRKTKMDPVYYCNLIDLIYCV